eukprot:CAMPEP_0118654948 /NCGR_PEP_ID=MMETSP0785-20121206/12661_1 /TAXON_ID=91992 /ORGANISM="Bolidomonas pacifica, Strain CCMP 1866" /LENGTH=591 /DNA_ID=CAMNT_0006547641 /DNA_START=71 /DNA_END=1842 /DNA_ORIENTATION=+
MTTPLALKQAVGSGSPSPMASPKKFSASDDDYLPEIDVNQLVVWNSKRRKCCGYLMKKGGSSGTSSLFGNRKNWQKRFFVLEHRVGPNENYLLKYFARPDDSKPKGSLPLDGAEVVEGQGRSKKGEKEFAFQLKVPGRKDVFDVTAENDKEKGMWIDTLKYVITVASNRGMLMRKKLGQAYAERDAANADYFVDEEDLPPSPRRVRGNGPGNPRMRFEIDCKSIPPQSSERARFVSNFQEDVGRFLFGSANMGASAIKVLEVKPAAGMDWLTVVEFDIVADFGDEGAKQAHLVKLNNLVANPNSDLYMGMVTCQVDSTFDGILESGEEGGRIDVPPTKRAIATPVPRVRSVLEKYMHLDLPPGAHDSSKFHVYLSFEGKTQTLWVASPRTLPRRSCVLWPYEVKDCLGISGTVSDVWMNPVALNPSGVPTSLAAPLQFTPSPKHGGLPIIDTSLLRQGVTYVVSFDDRRLDCISDLTDDQKEEIASTFARYDVNGDGNISREECMVACKGRTDAGLLAIERQFEAALREAKDEAEREKIIEQKEVHVQKVKEAEVQLLAQLTKADVDGDGELTEQEFYLAEAWWMKSTLNP